MSRGVAGLVALAVAGIGILAVSLRVEHHQSTALPVPTGPFAVGRTSYDWVDNATADPLAPKAGAKRELLAWVWYPVSVGRSDTIDAYLPANVRSAVDRARGPVIAGLLTRDLAKVMGHSLRGALVSTRERSYPVVIFRGGASAEVWNYSSLTEDLASHGYVVVGFDAPYRTNVVVFPDGRTLRRAPANDPERAIGAADSSSRINKLLAAWTGDVGYALDRLGQLNAPGSGSNFAGRLDMSRVGVFGHSFGGATAAAFCTEDPRCTAGIDIDGAPIGDVISEGIHRPFMFLLSDHGTASDRDGRVIMANIKSIADRLPPREGLTVSIHGASHFLFSDDGALLKSHILVGILRFIGAVGIDGRRQIAVTAHCVSSFFDASLRGSGGAPIDVSSHAAMPSTLDCIKR